MELYVQIGFGVVLLIIGILLVFNMVQNGKIRRTLIKSEHELQDNYQNLKSAYEEIVHANEELAVHCEELTKSKERMQKTAYTDYLTCLPNRLGYSEYIEAEVSGMSRDETMAILDMDIDNFKLINESYGHSYGDDTLREFGRRLTRLALERGAYIARIGGDEFAVVLKDFSTREELMAADHAMYSAGFGYQADVGNDHVLLHGLAHVIDRQRRRGNGGQGLHLHAGSAVAGDGSFDLHGFSAFIQRKLQVDAVHQDGVAHGDNIRSALCTHYAGDLGNGEDIRGRP